MMKRSGMSIPCMLHLNTRLGRLAEPIRFESIAKAVMFARSSWYFAYRIFTLDGKLKKQGLCDN